MANQSLFGMNQFTKKYTPTDQMGGLGGSTSLSQPAGTMPMTMPLPGGVGLPKQFQGTGAMGRMMLGQANVPGAMGNTSGTIYQQSAGGYDPNYLGQFQNVYNPVFQQRHEAQMGLGQRALETIEPSRTMDYGMPQEYWQSRERVQIGQVAQQAASMRQQAADARRRGMISAPEYDRRMQEIEMFERQGTGQARAAVAREQQEQAFAAQQAAAQLTASLYAATPSAYPSLQNAPSAQYGYAPPPSTGGGGGGYSIIHGSSGGGAGPGMDALNDAAARAQALTGRSNVRDLTTNQLQGLANTAVTPQEQALWGQYLRNRQGAATQQRQGQIAGSFQQAAGGVQMW